MGLGFWDCQRGVGGLEKRLQKRGLRVIVIIVALKIGPLLLDLG